MLRLMVLTSAGLARVVGAHGSDAAVRRRRLVSPTTRDAIAARTDSGSQSSLGPAAAHLKWVRARQRAPDARVPRQRRRTRVPAARRRRSARTSTCAPFDIAFERRRRVPAAAARLACCGSASATAPTQLAIAAARGRRACRRRSASRSRSVALPPAPDARPLARVAARPIARARSRRQRRGTRSRGCTSTRVTLFESRLSSVRSRPTLRWRMLI